MKLELKHLAPYLPYELKWMIGDKLFYTGYFSTKRIALMNPRGFGEPVKYSFETFPKYVRPILRPLSDLTKEIEHNGEKFIPTNELAIHLFDDITASVILEGNTDGIPYWVMEKLFEWHFDVSGLIPEGLAIDINTL